MKTFFLLLLLHIAAAAAVHVKFFNVVHYGAISGGKSDNVKAFLRAWKEACEFSGESRFWVPKGTFLLGPVSFNGPCNGTAIFVVKGVLNAPTDKRSRLKDTWIGFRYVDYLTVKGGGLFDGQGDSAWRHNDCHRNSHCRALPTTLRLDFVRNSSLENIRSFNSKSSHINLFACEHITISRIHLQAPETSPNTDGIRIGTSNNIRISDSKIGTGDDCISMVSGARRVSIRNVVCGPGHGISVGSLGRSHEHEYVQGIHVNNCTFVGTDNGVRIKTWAPSLYSVASNMKFENIVVKNARNPIFIDQNYCPHSRCDGQSSSAVQIRDVMFRNIRGVSRSEIAVKLQCSEALPCKNVRLMNIDLAYDGPGGNSRSECLNVIGSSAGKMLPPPCL